MFSSTFMRVVPSLFLSLALAACSAGSPDPTGGTGGGGSGGEGVGSSALSSSGGDGGSGGAVPDAGPPVDPLKELCLATAGLTIDIQCCASEGPWQDTCAAPAHCGEVLTCDAQGFAVLQQCRCADGSCFDPKNGCVPQGAGGSP